MDKICRAGRALTKRILLVQGTVANEVCVYTAAEGVATLVLQLLLPQTLKPWRGLAEQLSGTVLLQDKPSGRGKEVKKVDCSSSSFLFFWACPRKTAVKES